MKKKLPDRTEPLTDCRDCDHREECSHKNLIGKWVDSDLCFLGGKGRIITPWPDGIDPDCKLPDWEEPKSNRDCDPPPPWTTRDGMIWDANGEMVLKLNGPWRWRIASYIVAAVKEGLLDREALRRILNIESQDCADNAAETPDDNAELQKRIERADKELTAGITECTHFSWAQVYRVRRILRGEPIDG